MDAEHLSVYCADGFDEWLAYALRSRVNDMALPYAWASARARRPVILWMLKP